VNASSVPRVALVVPALELGGGVPTVAQFLYRVISESSRYCVQVISLATSATDGQSVRLLSPPTWSAGISIREDSWRGIPFRHVGAALTEIEFQRYRPRRMLSDLLQGFDLVQVVAGSPAWLTAARGFRGPLALQVATLVRVERGTRLRQTRGLARVWLELMTRVTASLETPALKRADAVFVENQWLFDRLAGKLGKRKVVYAPPGVDTDAFRPQAYQHRGHVLSVGRFADPRKKVRLLFDAFARLRAMSNATPDLVLVGQRPSDDDWEYAVSRGLADAVRIRENVSQEELAELYRAASVFVLSSDEEGLGLVILEAMASGVPVVSTASGGPQTVVNDGETGFLTPIQDADSLAKGMQRVLSEPLVAAQMGRQGRLLVERRFSLAATGEAFLRTYDALLGR
jgi:D-inositol-3-phosphate glycosyltransferase